jgi:hypothetical protein
MIWIIVWTTALAAISIWAANHMRRHACACDNCGNHTALATGEMRSLGVPSGSAIAVDASVEECERSCNSCGATFWSAV